MSWFDPVGETFQGMTEEDTLQCFVSGTLLRLLTLKAPQASTGKSESKRWPFPDVSVLGTCLSGQDTSQAVPVQHAADSE